MYYTSVLRLAAEGDTADRKSKVSGVVISGNDVTQTEVQGIGDSIIEAN